MEYLYTPRYCYISPLCFTAQRRLQVHDRFFQFLRNFHQLTAFEQAEMILYAALDPTVASRAKKGEFVMCLDHFELLQSSIN